MALGARAEAHLQGGKFPIAESAAKETTGSPGFRLEPCPPVCLGPERALTESRGNQSMLTAASGSAHLKLKSN